MDHTHSRLSRSGGGYGPMAMLLGWAGGWVGDSDARSATGTAHGAHLGAIKLHSEHSIVPQQCTFDLMLQVCALWHCLLYALVGCACVAGPTTIGILGVWCMHYRVCVSVSILGLVHLACG